LRRFGTTQAGSAAARSNVEYELALGQPLLPPGVTMFARLAASLHTLGFTLQSRLRNDERGATAVEYGLMVALIAVVLIAGVGAFGTSLNTFFSGLFAKLGL
jgi:pilus assembly protein Flp/PilA